MAKENLLGKIPPQNVEAESAVLGAILVNKEAMDKIGDILIDSDFYLQPNQIIYRAILRLYEKRSPIDLVTLTNELESLKQLDDAGGAAYLAELVNSVPTAIHVAHYAEIVRQKSVLRRILNAGQKISVLGYEEDKDVQTVLDEAEKALFEVSHELIKDNFMPIADILATSFDRIDRLHREKGVLRGVTSGFRDLDNKLSGLQPSDLIILAARPSMGKCLTASTKVIDPQTGKLNTIKHIVETQSENGELSVASLYSDWKLRAKKASAFLFDGSKPVFKLKTASGREIEATLPHPFLTINGWKQLSTLRVGERIAVARELPYFGAIEWPEFMVKALAYFIADGSVSKSQTSPGFTNVNSEIIKDFTEATKGFGAVEVKRANFDERAPTYKTITREKINPVKQFLVTQGIWGKTAHQKSFPEVVFQFSKSQVALLLNRLFSCDGAASISTSPAISYSTVSYKLAMQVQHLLLRFGINSKLRTKFVKYKQGRNKAFELEIHGKTDILKFIKEIGIFGKEAAVEKLDKAVSANIDGWTKDTLPLEVWGEIELAKGDMSWAEINRKLGNKPTHNLHAWKRNPRRETLAKIANALGSTKLLQLSNSDVYWDRITSITPIGIQPVYDITIPETHNFIANDFVTHNTTLALNMALNAAVKGKTAVGFFSLEQSKEQIVDRLICAQAMVDGWKLRTGNLSEDDFPAIGMAMGTLAEAPLFIDDSPMLTPIEIRTRARRLKADHNLGLIVIDYLQLIGSNRGFGGGDNRVQEVSEISRSLKALARELDVPVIALSQLSRAVESRDKKIPQLSDLRESGSIEQDADIVMFLYREDYYDRETERKGITDLLIRKHRNGPIGEVELHFRAEQSRFFDIDRKTKAALQKPKTEE
ncbi:replicative DNA helicase [Candidatus Berkelbacteria bacterium]|nr:replicative DNA helicase [Candidatus Berkelbacteria bacterium]